MHGFTRKQRAKRDFPRAGRSGPWLAGSLLALGHLAAPVGATSYTVNTLADNTTSDGSCTLREAILAANNAAVNLDCGAGSSANDTITFSVSGTITLGSTLPSIVSGQGTLTIDGGGSITISGGGSVRVMIVDPAADLTLQNLTISNGNAGSGDGGGIKNLGNLTVTSSTFTGNSASFGGAIATIGGGSTVAVTHSTFTNNTASGSSSSGGGAISSWNADTLRVTNCSFSGNQANDAGGWGGGGILSFGTVLTVTGSTFEANSANLGGGISAAGDATIANCTFSNNFANEGGGVRTNSCSVGILNSTFSGNTASSRGGALSTWQSGAPPVTEVRNSILANSGSSYDCWNAGGTLSGSNNIIESTPTGANSCAAIVFSSADPNLGALTGTPAYFPLNPGSLAIDAGDNTTCQNPPVSNQSQNGVTRPQDGDGNTVAVCDIGSFEAPAVAPATADMVANGGSVPPSLGPGGVYSLSFSCTNNGPGAAANATCGVSVSVGSVSGVSCSPSVPVASLPSGSTISCTYTFTAPGSQGGDNTAETGVTFTFTAGSATSDPDTSNNTATSGATPIPLVDALDDAASFPASTVGATFNVEANDQYGSGSLPSGSPSPSFSLVSGSTTCTGASINAGGVATFNVPASGTCVVAYQVCVSGACDNAQLLVTPTYTITVSVNPSGGGSVTCAPNPVPHGSSTTCTINANPGYSLQSVTGCGGTLSGSSYTIPSVTGACTVNVTFQQQQAEPIPTLEEWGLVTLITLLAASGVVLLRRLWA